MNSYDIIVIGSGGGLKIAEPAAGMGMKVALIEQGAMGGTCLNRGCIPSKMMIYPGHIADLMRNCGKYNITCDSAIITDYESIVLDMIKQTNSISTKIEEKYSSMSSLDLYRDKARFISNKVIAVGDTEISGTRIYIATGSVPYIPEIEGLRGTPYMTSTDALKRRHLPERMMRSTAGGPR